MAQTNVNILIAEDNAVSRELMAGILKTQGYNVIGATDGAKALGIINSQNIDLALVDINMEPMGGFEFARNLLVRGLKIPILIVTADDSTDILNKATALGISRVLQKPIDPSRLLSAVQRILRQYGHTSSPLSSQSIETRYTSEQLMQRAVELAERNAMSKRGGPFGAIVAARNGMILGEGTNGITSRVDPTAHAEIMAIRQAADKLGRADLSDCVLYCSSEPTMMGKALIISVGIREVYYGLTHADIQSIRSSENKVRAQLSGQQKPETNYTQLGREHALTVLNRWQALSEKIPD